MSSFTSHFNTYRTTVEFMQQYRGTKFDILSTNKTYCKLDQFLETSTTFSP